MPNNVLEIEAFTFFDSLIIIVFIRQQCTNLYSDNYKSIIRAKFRYFNSAFEISVLQEVPDSIGSGASFNHEPVDVSCTVQ